MALMRKRKYEKHFVQILNETAKAVEEKDNPSPISLEALGLLVNLWSYDVETWDLPKQNYTNDMLKIKKLALVALGLNWLRRNIFMNSNSGMAENGNTFIFIVLNRLHNLKLKKWSKKSLKNMDFLLLLIFNS